MPSRGSWTTILASVGSSEGRSSAGQAVARQPPHIPASLQPSPVTPSEPPPALGIRSHRAAPFAADVVWTTITTALIGVAVIILNADLARRGAAEVFGPVNYAKRAAGMTVPVLSLCMTVGVVRYVAGAASETERRIARVGAIWLVFGVMVIGTLVVALLGPWIASITALQPLPLLWAMWAYSVSMVLNGLSHSLRRAELRQGAANWISLWANALVPVLVVVFAPRSWGGSLLLMWISVPVLAWHAAELVVISIRNALAVDVWSGCADVWRRLSAYSLGRVPGSVAASAMSAVGPFIAARGGLPEGGALPGLLAAFAVVSIASYSLQAVGVVVLPRASALSAGRTKGLRVMATRLLVASVLLSAVAVPPAFVLAPDVCVVWFGPRFITAAPLVRIVLLAVPAVLLQVLLRSLIDGVIERAWNTYAMLAGLIVCLTGSVLVHSASGLAVAFAAGTWVTGILTLAMVRTRFHAGVSRDAWLVSLAFGFTTAITSWLALVWAPQGIARLAVAGGVAAALAALPFIRGTALYGMLWMPREMANDDAD